MKEFSFYNLVNVDFKSRYRIDPVPNTAEGYEKTRCYLTTDYGHKYFVSAINDKLYFINYCPEYNYQKPFSVWFTIDGSKITIVQAVMNGKTYKAERMLNKFAQITYFIATAIITANIVEYVPYPLPKKPETLHDFYTNTKKQFIVYDNISGECLSDITSSYIAESDVLNRLSWHDITVEASEDCGDYIAVYVSY